MNLRSLRMGWPSVYEILIGVGIMTLAVVSTENNRVKESQGEYSQLYNQAIACVEDVSSGLSSFGKMSKLYLEAGVNIEYDPITKEVRFPRLTKENLETVIENCEN